MASVEIKKTTKLNTAADSTDYQTIPISSRFSFELQPTCTFEGLSDGKKRLIDTIWHKEQKRRGGMLHDGQILNVLGYDQKKLTGCFVSYKYFFAQVCDPSLKADLKIIPASVSGFTLPTDHVLIGKRAPWVAQDPNKFELAPSGGIQPPMPGQEQISLKDQLLEELKEEVQVPPSLVKGVKFFALVRDLKRDAIELIAEIPLKSGAAFSSSPEYSLIMTLPVAEIQAFVKAHILDFVPLSIHILKLRNLL